MKRHYLILFFIAIAAIIFFFGSLWAWSHLSNDSQTKARHHLFYFFGPCPSGYSDLFDQSQNIFMPSDLIMANKICCSSGYYGTLTSKGTNICCANGFSCSSD